MAGGASQVGSKKEGSVDVSPGAEALLLPITAEGVFAASESRSLLSTCVLLTVSIGLADSDEFASSDMSCSTNLFWFVLASLQTPGPLLSGAGPSDRAFCGDM